MKLGGAFKKAGLYSDPGVESFDFLIITEYDSDKETLINENGIDLDEYFLVDSFEHGHVLYKAF